MIGKLGGGYFLVGFFWIGIFGDVGFDEGCFYVVRIDGVEVDVGVGVVEGEGFGEVDDSMFGDCVGEVVVDGDDVVDGG